MKHILPQTSPLWFIVVIVFLFAGFPLQGQELLSSHEVPKFVNPLPIPSEIDARAGGIFHVTITQFEQDLGLGLQDMYGKPVRTTVWGYNGQYPGPTFLAKKDVPVQVFWHNYLTTGAEGTGSFLPHLLPVDGSNHWALGQVIKKNGVTDWEATYGVPIVTHLHGGHTESESDGLPEAWYTPRFEEIGANFRKGDTAPYYYHNDQEAATLWYHDHTLGITRLNVYAGLAGFYLLTDENEQRLRVNNILPATAYDIEVVIQDRMFTKDGQL
ncbi:multicopper oxidase domain-containing protein [Pontibacter sp. MBLB2868]|uniref:multicopper oxidase domain-containing protein n=1 Tax=Pontibacter sp. MBLB2868 TaxID=3451555 RepID=UPI003F753910